VIPGGTGLDKVIEEQDEARSSIVPPPIGVSNFTKWLGIAVGVAAGLALLAGIVYLFKKMGSSGSGSGTAPGKLRGTAKQVAEAVGSVAAVATAKAKATATTLTPIPTPAPITTPKAPAPVTPTGTTIGAPGGTNPSTLPIKAVQIKSS
jgi:hypothetical protein